MATVYKKANRVAAMHTDTRKAVKAEAAKVEVKAIVNLNEANASGGRITTKTKPENVYFPAEIERKDGVTEWGFTEWVILHAPNAMALEFGHAPSGVFRGTDTKPPDGEYILTDAAYGGI